MTFRPPRAEDQAYLRDSWWREASRTDLFRGMSRAFILDMLDAFMKSPTWKTVVMCDALDTDEIYGWAVYRTCPRSLAYMAVKSSIYEGHGLPIALVKYMDLCENGPINAMFPPWACKGLGLTFQCDPYLRWVAP